MPGGRVLKCWMCSAELKDRPVPLSNGRMKWDCDVCGDYTLSHEAQEDGNPVKQAERYRLSYWCKQRQLNGQSMPYFADRDEAQEILNTIPTVDPSEKPDILLASLARLAPIPGHTFAIDPLRQYSLAYAHDEREFRFYCAALERARQIESTGQQFIITAPGWARLRELRTQPSRSKTAFVAMKFSADMHATYEAAIGPAIEAAGFSPVLANTPEHNDRIDAHIMVQIKSARFIVSDVTHQNAGVYFEAGYAIGLGRPVIWTCKESELERVHFDTRQYNTVLWNSTDELRLRLRDRIIATIP